nr:flagellar hook-basal body complex protein FliE [Hoeflea marina]
MPGVGISPGAVSGPSFTDVLQSLSTDVVGNLRNAETQSLRSVHGEADTREVVDALMSAEQSLQTAIAIRDKVVSAYLEITKMQI